MEEPLDREEEGAWRNAQSKAYNMEEEEEENSEQESELDYIIKEDPFVGVCYDCKCLRERGRSTNILKGLKLAMVLRHLLHHNLELVLV